VFLGGLPSGQRSTLDRVTASHTTGRVRAKGPPGLRQQEQEQEQRIGFQLSTP